MGEEPTGRDEHSVSLEFATEDDGLPTPHRIGVLREAYKRNLAANQPPYAGVELLDIQELLWILSERGWRTFETDARENPSTDRPNLTRVQLGMLDNGRDMDLSGVDLIEADFQGQYEPPDWSGALFCYSDLSGANLTGLTLEGADMRAYMPRVVLQRCNLSNATLQKATLKNADLSRANLHGADLSGADLRGADLSGADLRGADLSGADLTEAILTGVDLREANLTNATLIGANLRGSRMDVSTSLTQVKLSETTSLANVVWNNVPLILLDWGRATTLGDEVAAQYARDNGGKAKPQRQRGEEYVAAVRAYRSLATALRSQGLNDYADNYAYRAQVMQREAFHCKRQWDSYLFSWFLFLISGYGYRLWRILATYAAVVL